MRVLRLYLPNSTLVAQPQPTITLFPSACGATDRLDIVSLQGAVMSGPRAARSCPDPYLSSENRRLPRGPRLDLSPGMLGNVVRAVTTCPDFPQDRGTRSGGGKAALEAAADGAGNGRKTGGGNDGQSLPPGINPLSRAPCATEAETEIGGNRKRETAQRGKFISVIDTEGVRIN